MAGLPIDGGSHRCPGVPEPLAEAHVARYLQLLGFDATTASEWGPGKLPTVVLHVTGHERYEGHTYYQIECSLQPVANGRKPHQAMSWHFAGRLKHLRHGLHDPAKAYLGSDYRMHFAGTPFARRMRPAGTTTRLAGWCRRLAHCMGAKALPPAMTAEALRCLGAPEGFAAKGGHAGHAHKILARGPVTARDGTAASGFAFGAGSESSMTSFEAFGGAADEDAAATSEDEGGSSSDSELNDMLATLGEAEAAFAYGTGGGLAGSSPSSTGVPLEEDSIGANHGVSGGLKGGGASGGVRFGTNSGIAVGAHAGAAAGTAGALATDPWVPAKPGRPLQAIMGGADDASSGGVRFAAPQRLEAAEPMPETRMQSKLRQRREVVDKQALSGRGKLF